MNLLLGIIIGGVAVVGIIVLWALLSEQNQIAAQAAAIAAAPTPVPLPPSHVWSANLAATNQEVFTVPLLNGRVYRLEIAGTILFDWRGSCRGADAAYYADSSGNFINRNDAVFIDDRFVRTLDSWREDRGMHEYSGLIEGTGTRAALRVNVPRFWGEYRSGAISFRLHLEPVGTLTAKGQQEAKALAEQAKWLQAQQAKAAADAAAAATEVQRRQQVLADQQRAALLVRVDALRSTVRHQINFLDPQFRAEYVRLHQQKVLCEHRQGWFREYDAIVADSELVAELNQSAPDVLRLYEARVRMVHEAERAAIMPRALPTPPTRQITASTLPYVNQALSELFQYTEVYDETRKKLASDGNQMLHRPVLEKANRAMTFYYDELARFGIFATTPEGAEIQFIQLCPPPAPTVYEDLIEQLKAGQRVPPDGLCERLEDLHREAIILQARRRAAIRSDDDRQRMDLDSRLSEIRKEATEIKGFLESIHCPIDLKDPRDREREVTLEDQFIKMYEGKKRVIQFLTKERDDPAIEHIEALYAQEQAKLFENNASYT